MSITPKHAAARAARTAATLLLAVAPVAIAHHGVSQYDMRETRVLDGIVEKWDWKSPHTWLTLAVTQSGVTETWEIEGAPPGWMERQGWTPASLSAGEAVSVLFHPARRTANAGILMEVTRRDGETLKVNRPAWLGGP